MTDLQKKELEILKCFISICEKMKIKYFLVCGSVIGAVKYQGFIPWDDDIDVGLLRPDYERFVNEAHNYLPDNLFLQNYHTEKCFPLFFSKLRDSNTTYIEIDKQNLPIHHGICIDVFPIDGCPDDKRIQKKIERKKKSAWNKSSCAMTMPSHWHKARLKAAFYRLFGYHKSTGKVISKFEKYISQWSVETSDLWCNHGNWQGLLEYAPKWHYGNGTFATFEGVKVRIPENYDEYLTQKYGDWRADLPEDKKEGHHYHIVCDVNNPYTKYIK